MCLATVSKTEPKSTGFGWKVFRRDNGKLCGEYCSQFKPRPLDQWLKEREYKEDRDLKFLKRPHYRLGWHIFKKKKDAKQWAPKRTMQRIVRKVEYRKAHTQGKQRLTMLSNMEFPIFMDCVVAEEIKILPLRRIK